MALPGTGQQAPTATPGTATPPSAPVAVIPFIRAARKKSALVSQFISGNLSANVANVNPAQITAAGYLKRLKVTVSAVTSGNSATVAFNADAPFNVLTQVFFNQPNGAALIQPIEGFDLYTINKYGAHNTNSFDPLSDPGYFVTTGAGATGGSFTFTLYIPCEIDERDGLGALANMAANQSYLFQYSLNTLAAIYSTAPTTGPVVTVTTVMEFYAAPQAMTPATPTTPAQPQQTAPTPNGSLSLIQIQNPLISTGAPQKFPILNMGNVVRYFIFILRTSGGVRTEVDWPTSVNIKYLGDVMFYKTRLQWNLEMATGYKYTAGKTAAPTLNALDNGVFVLVDFMNSGGLGDNTISGASQRDLLLPTNSATLLEFEALTAWGGSAGLLKIIQNCINPANAASIYHPFVN